MENTTLMVCADHGQADGIGGHGHLDEGERYVPFFMVGPGSKGRESPGEKKSRFYGTDHRPFIRGAISKSQQGTCPQRGVKGALEAT